MKNEAIVELMGALEAEQKAQNAVFRATIKLLTTLLVSQKFPANGSSRPDAPTSVHPPPQVRWPTRIRSVIQNLAKPFSIEDVIQCLIQEAKAKADEGEAERIHYSDPIRRIISNEINKLRYAKKLEVVQAGSGSRGGLYRHVTI
jgi:hypothetical protein